MDDTNEPVDNQGQPVVETPVTPAEPTVPSGEPTPAAEPETPVTPEGTPAPAEEPKQE